MSHLISESYQESFPPETFAWKLLKEQAVPEFFILELFSLESLMTKCLIQRVGAVISEREGIFKSKHVMNLFYELKTFNL